MENVCHFGPTRHSGIERPVEIERPYGLLIIHFHHSSQNLHLINSYQHRLLHNLNIRVCVKNRIHDTRSSIRMWAGPCSQPACSTSSVHASSLDRDLGRLWNLLDWCPSAP